MDSALGRVRGSREDAIGWIVFDNPLKHNAYSSEMAGQALELIRSYETDPAVRVVVLRGEGEKSFISGGDISKFDAARVDAATTRADRQNSEAFRRRLLDLPKPTIAMIHGYCLGGGVAIALSADMRFGATTAQIGIPAALRGIAYPTESVRLLVELIGPSRAKDLLFSGRRVEAEEALRVGLLNAVHEPGDLEESTRAYAAVLAANAPLSIRASKFCIDQMLVEADRRDQAEIDRLHDQAANSADFKEATLAFMEKRKPVFQGA